MGMISFDVDGVLANFTRGFTRYCNLLFHTPVCDFAPMHWYFEEWDRLGLTKEQVGAAWKFMEVDPDFWAELDPFNPSVMPRINAIKNRVFITNRAGVDPKRQTERFLEAWGIQNPLVHLASDKVPVAKELKVVAHIDDYPPNCVQLKKALPNAYVALFYANYNTHAHSAWEGMLKHPIVVSVDQYLDECERLELVEYE